MIYPFLARRALAAADIPPEPLEGGGGARPIVLAAGGAICVLLGGMDVVTGVGCVGGSEMEESGVVLTTAAAVVVVTVVAVVAVVVVGACRISVLFPSSFVVWLMLLLAIDLLVVEDSGAFNSFAVAVAVAVAGGLNVLLVEGVGMESFLTPTVAPDARETLSPCGLGIVSLPLTAPIDVADVVDADVDVDVIDDDDGHVAVLIEAGIIICVAGAPMFWRADSFNAPKRFFLVFIRN